MGKYLPALLLNKLDAAIAKNENAKHKSQYKSGGAILLVAVIYLFNVIIQGIQGSWGLSVFYIGLGVALVVTAGWDLIAYRRSLEKENKSSDEYSTSFLSELWTFLSVNGKTVAAIVGILVIASGLSYFGITGGGALGVLPLSVVIALVLKARHVRHLENGPEFLSDASTGEFPSGETTHLLDEMRTLPIDNELRVGAEDDEPLTMAHLSVTEETTKPLTIPKVFEEEVPTTRKLDDLDK